MHLDLEEMLYKYINRKFLKCQCKFNHYILLFNDYVKLKNCLHKIIQH